MKLECFNNVAGVMTPARISALDYGNFDHLDQLLADDGDSITANRRTLRLAETFC